MFNLLFNYLVRVYEEGPVFIDEFSRWERLCGWVLNTFFGYRYKLQILTKKWAAKESFYKSEHKKLGRKFDKVVEELARVSEGDPTIHIITVPVMDEPNE